MVLDKITETIAHFIGLFEISVEEARLREHYRKFEEAAHAEPEAEFTATRSVVIRSPHEFDGFDPYIPYTPAPPPPGSAWTGLDLVDRRLDIELASAKGWFHPDGFRLGPKDIAGSSGGIRLPALDPPGSVAVIVEQNAVMSDDDTIIYGGHGLALKAVLDPAASLETLTAHARALSGLMDAERPGTADAIRDFIASRREALGSDPAGPAGAHIATLSQDVLEGVYVNGTLADAAPRFADYRPEEGDEEEGPFPGGWQPSLPDRVLGQALEDSLDRASDGSAPGTAFHSAVELQAGGNTLVNSVVLHSSWLAATVTAVAGDHVEFNAIFQANVWSDIDHVTSAIGAAPGDVATIGFNIAAFERIDAQAGSPAPAGDFPNFWVVTQITGDLMILNWIEQMSFMTDNDLAILSATGSRAEIVAGENGARNAVSLAELGHAYDLIVVGGSVYDASVIYQMNLLLDDDLVGALEGFTGAGTVATAGNLLWNEAGILNVGAADRFEAMTQAYRDAASHLAAGNKSALPGVLGDPAFAGGGPLKVLYITGDIINLNFVKQTNVLGDSDQVALAMDAAKAAPNAQWTVATGANTLVNYAQIADFDALGKTYVGGQTYSDEILVQAEFVSDRPSFDLAGRGPDALVNEAVAFLDDDFGHAPHGSDMPHHLIAPPTDAMSADPMQTLLA